MRRLWFTAILGAFVAGAAGFLLHMIARPGGYVALLGLCRHSARSVTRMHHAYLPPGSGIISSFFIVHTFLCVWESSAWRIEWLRPELDSRITIGL